MENQLPNTPTSNDSASTAEERKAPVIKNPICQKCPLIALLLILFTLVVALAGVYIFWPKDTNGALTMDPMKNTTAVDETTPTPQMEGTVKYESLPVYSGVSITEDMKLDGGGRRIAYETSSGTTSKQVMDYYETELTALGWQKVIRDVDNAQLEMLSGDQTKLRVWIYFEGTDLDGADQLPLTFIVDFGPPMGEYLPVPIQ